MERNPTSEYIPDDERDAILQKLLQLPENKVCFDCQSKNPKWCSANIGIFLCYQCTGNHRGMGVHISFVRSLKMDRWKLRELKQMEFGGNKLAKAFYEKNGMITQGQPPDHKNPTLTRYKNELRMKAEQAVGGQVLQQTQEQPTSAPGQITVPKSNIIIMGGANAAMNLQQELSKEEVKAEKKPEPVVAKKPRAFVAEADIFDFSGLQKTLDQPKQGGLVINKVESNNTSANKRVSQGSSNISQSKKLDDEFQLGNFFQGKNAAPVNLNAKKLDFDFDGDDFFNSFDPNAKKLQEKSKAEQEPKKIEVKQEIDKNEAGALKFGQNIKVDDKSKSMPFADFAKNEDLFNMQTNSNNQSSSINVKNETQEITKSTQKSSGAVDDDVQARYEALVKSGATAISSDMLFGNEPKPESEAGRWSTPASLSALGDKLQDHMVARSSVGSGGSGSVGEYITGAKQSIKNYAPKTYETASNTKNAALDWITSMTSGSTANQEQPESNNGY